MKQQFAIVDFRVDAIQDVRLTKPKKLDSWLRCLPCELGSYNRLKALKDKGQPLFDEKFILSDDGVIYCKDIYINHLAHRRRRELESRIEGLIVCAESSYPWSSDYKTIFKSLSLEEKMEALFEMSFRALARLNDKLDRDTFENYRSNP